MDTDEAAPASNDTDVNMQDAKGASDTAGAESNASGAENGASGTGDKPAQMETDTKVSVILLVLCSSLFTCSNLNVLQHHVLFDAY